MHTSDYVYVLQVMRFWLDDMHRKNYERITEDPEEEELLVDAIMCYDDLFEGYQQAYDPKTNMVPPDWLKWEAWRKRPDWPEELQEYFPEDKYNVEKAEN